MATHRVPRGQGPCPTRYMTDAEAAGYYDVPIGTALVNAARLKSTDITGVRWVAGQSRAITAEIYYSNPDTKSKR